MKEHSTWRKLHYNAADENDKLIINLRELGHILRILSEGKGSQKRILIVLDEINSSITQQKLTERLGIRPGSASEVIAKLEIAGYIERTPSESDRRTTDIKLTEAGREMASEAKRQRMRRHEEMFSCLTVEEKKELLSLLEKLNADWDDRYQSVGKESVPDKNHHGNHMHRKNNFKKGE